MKYQAIEKLRETYPLEQLCKALGVSKSGYYAWGQREPSQRDQADARLREKIVLLWQKFRRVYGAPRVYHELLSQGIRTSRMRVVRLMREAGIQGKMPRRKQPRTTHSDVSHPWHSTCSIASFRFRSAIRTG